MIQNYPGKDYYKLCDVLGLENDPDNRFSTNVFFEEFNKKLPVGVLQENNVVPYTPRTRNDVPDSEKNYFWYWKVHKDKTGVSTRNLKKTAALLGSDIAEICRAANISSCWTANEQFAKNS